MNDTFWGVTIKGKIVLYISKKKIQSLFSQIFGNRRQAKPYPELTKKLYLVIPPTSKKLRGILDSGCPSVHAWHFLMHAISYEPCMLGFLNSYMDSSWKNSWHKFFFFFLSCPSYLPFWSSCLPFWSYIPLKKKKKIRMKSDACHILWTVRDRILKFHIWIPHGKIAENRWNEYERANLINFVLFFYSTALAWYQYNNKWIAIT